jgi:hypothetical protein
VAMSGSAAMTTSGSVTSGFAFAARMGPLLIGRRS